MSILDIISKNKQSTQENTKQESLQDLNKLSGPEIDFLLRTLKTCTIKGEHVEIFYNIAIKLQNQFVEQQQN